MPKHTTRRGPAQRLLISVLAAWAALAARPALADAVATSGWSLGLLGGEAVNHNLGDLLPKAIEGELDFKPARLTGFVLRHELQTPASWADWAQRHGVQTRSSLEVDLLKGSGLVDNTEFDIAWRPAVTPWPEQALQVEFAWSVGVSHSFGQPWSDHTTPARPEGYRTLFHMAPEVALRWWDHPDWALALRVQHRSGLYGVFAPRRVGSNHLAILLTHDF